MVASSESSGSAHRSRPHSKLLFASAHSQKRTQSSVGHSEQDPSYLNTVTSLPPWEPGQVTNKFRQIPLSDHPHAWTLQPRRALFSQGSAAPSKQAYEARGRGGDSTARQGVSNESGHLGATPGLPPPLVPTSTTHPLHRCVTMAHQKCCLPITSKPTTRPPPVEPKTSLPWAASPASLDKKISRTAKKYVSSAHVRLKEDQFSV